MSERVPSLDVVAKVANIDDEAITALQNRHIETSGDQSEYFQETVAGLFSPADALRATIIASREFRSIQLFPGIETLDKERVEELAAHLEQALPPLPEEPVPTLPAQHTGLGHSRSLQVISIAGSPDILQRRALAKLEIAKFLGVKAIPERLWLDEEETTARVWLATGPKKRTAMMRALSATINEEKDILPEGTEFGPIKARTDQNA